MSFKEEEIMDFKQEVLKIKEDMLKDIKALCLIDSVLDESTSQVGQPFGKGNKEVLDAMLAIGIRDGYRTKNVDGYAGHIDIGEGQETVGILGHLDVVPVNKEGWIYPPFDMTIDNDCIYGRGVADDKGPLLAAYYAAKIIDKINFPKKRKIRVIFGCNEESGSNCMKYYFKKEKFPTLGFTPDAGFPVCYGEKAMAFFSLHGEKEDSKLISFTSGTVANVVPEEAIAKVEGTADIYQKSFDDYLNKRKLSGSITNQEGYVVFQLVGKSAHASTPDKGINAAVYLCEYLNTVIADSAIAFVSKFFTDDNHALKLGFYHRGEMGEITVNLGVMQITKEDGIKIVLDMRCPHELKEETIVECMDKVTSDYFLSYTHRMLPYLYVNPSSELITKLHEAYVHVSGDVVAKPMTMGGGTYAKEMPNCVAFGISFPGVNNKIHENNEFISINDLLVGTEIYATALYELIKAE